MQKQKIFSKGQWIHAMVTTTQYPNILIPVKGKVHDVKFDGINPLYQIKVHRFYDNIVFLRMYLFGNHVQTDFNGGTTRFKITPSAHKTVDELIQNVFNGENWQRHLIVVDGIFCSSSEERQRELFAKLQDFLIQEKLKEIYELGTRAYYQRLGRFNWQSLGEYRASLKKFLGERMPSDENWFHDLVYRPYFNELDKAENP